MHNTIIPIIMQYMYFGVHGFLQKKFGHADKL